MLFLVFILMFFILIQHLFKLQIIEGDEYADNFNLSTTKTRTIKSTRGNIRDRNGQLLAHNQLSYSIILEDNGTYDSNREKNLTLNYVAYSLMKILEPTASPWTPPFTLWWMRTGNMPSTPRISH